MRGHNRNEQCLKKCSTRQHERARSIPRPLSTHAQAHASVKDGGKFKARKKFENLWKSCFLAISFSDIKWVSFIKKKKKFYDLVTKSRNIFMILKIYRENGAIKTALSFDLFYDISNALKAFKLQNYPRSINITKELLSLAVTESREISNCANFVTEWEIVLF